MKALKYTAKVDPKLGFIFPFSGMGANQYSSVIPQILTSNYNYIIAH